MAPIQGAPPRRRGSDVDDPLTGHVGTLGRP